MLINNLKTGNTVIDYIVNIISISFITFFFQNINHLKKYILQFFSMIIFLDKKKIEIIKNLDRIRFVTTEFKEEKQNMLPKKNNCVLVVKDRCDIIGKIGI
jgi:c-di-AMP phosphodiesterase-like protein